MLPRRVVVLGSLLGMAGGVLAQAPNPSRIRRIGVLMPYPGADRVIQDRLAAFRKELLSLGWAEGTNLSITQRWVGDDRDAIQQAAREFSDQNVDVLLTAGSRVIPVVQRMAQSTSIVFVGVSDPVGQGFVESLARPGRNTTGFSIQEFDGEKAPLVGKLFEIMFEIAPGVRSAAIVYNPDNPASKFNTRTFDLLAEAKGIKPIHIRVANIDDIDRGLAAFTSERGEALILPSDLTLLGLRDQVVELVARHRLLAVYSDRSFVEGGGLVSYSADRMDQFRRAAAYVDRILRGARAGDLPIQQPVAYELVVNLRSARALGIAIPAALLARTDDVID